MEDKLQTNAKQIRERLDKVRAIMKAHNIDVYVVPTGDYHISEYAGDYFKEREYITGFTGSAGTAVISADEAVLFTDGRYYVQAERQLMGSSITLMRMGSEVVPTLLEYCSSRLKSGKTIGFDGRCLEARQGIALRNAALEVKADCDYEFNAIEEIYENRAEFPHSRAYYLDEKYSGESIESKLERVREGMKKEKADCHIVAALDDICWLYNIRGNDVHCNPVIMSYSCIYKDRAVLYTDMDRLTANNGIILNKLEKAGVSISPYNQIYEDISLLGTSTDINIQPDKQSAVNNEYRLLLDTRRVNTRLYMLAAANDNISIVDKQNPEVLLKSIKNKTELDNLRAVHIDDGLAVTRFIFWLKDAIRSGQAITEYMAAQYLDGLRSRISDYVELSFDTISAYADNAAMMHYQATKDNCARLKEKGMLLVDSGGQYLRGTTDVTRTIALGPVTDEIKKCYTLTLKGMLNLANAHFLYGCTGYNLDIMARAPLWEENIDYRCGTGHGIGYLLNVHEAPNGFRWKHIQGVNDLAVLEEGMVTSDEPGVYVEGQFGIRIENEIVVVKDKENEYGSWLRFDTFTAVPVELELIDKKYLNDKDIEQLNTYHKWVYECLSPYMEGEELEKLKQSTRAI